MAFRRGAAPRRRPRTPAVATVPATLATRNAHLVSLWLFTLCGMLLVMIALGGATRLTGSGLSIMEWRPVTGIIPPLTHAQWEHEFALYQHHPAVSHPA